jgi:DNA anti-recombination protein RmuC
MKKEEKNKKITPQKTVSQDSHTAEIKRYIKEVISESKELYNTLSAESDRKYKVLVAESDKKYNKIVAESDRKYKKVVAESDERIKKYIAINTEDFQDRLSAVAEQFIGLNEKLDATTKTLSERIDLANEKLDSHTVMIGRLMIDMEEVKVGMREKVGRDEFNKLETRLVTLESIVFSGRANSGQKVNGK